MKHLYKILAVALLTGFLPGCVEDPQMPDDIRNALAPEVVTGKPENSSATSVSISGTVKKLNGAPTLLQGFCWGTESPVTFENMEDSLQVPVQDAQFSALVTGLSNAKIYYIAAFARNIAGVTIGEAKSFSTISGLGTVETLEPDSILAASALGGGKILNRGEGVITARGVYYWKEGSSAKDSVLSTMSTDSFTCKIAGLAPNTKYNVQAFARNVFGLFPGGTTKTFTTTSGKSEIVSFAKVAVGYTSATFTATVQQEGDAPVLQRGFCYGTNATPTIANDTILCGTGAGTFTGEIKHLSSHTQYFIRAYAINTYGVTYSKEILDVITLNELPTVSIKSVSLGIYAGDIYVAGDVLDDGNSAITEAGFCWSTTTTPSIADDHQACTTEIGAFEGEIKAAKGSRTYYIRTYATNAAGTSYSSEVKLAYTPPIFANAASFVGGTRIPGSAGYFGIDSNAGLLGGDTGPSYTNELYLYSTVGGWQAMNPYPIKCAWLAAVNFDKAIFSLGGRNEANQLVNKFYAYSLVNNQWTDLTTATTPTAVARAAGSRMNISIFYVGGIRRNASTTAEYVSNDVWRYTPVTNEWSQMPSFPESQFGGLTFSEGNVLYSGFGLTNIGTSPVYTQKLMRSSDQAASWSLETTMPGGSVQAGVMHQGSLYVVDVSGFVWNYNLTTKEWTKKSQLNTANRTVHCMYSIGSLLYIGLGTSNMLISYDPMWDN